MKTKCSRAEFILLVTAGCHTRNAAHGVQWCHKEAGFSGQSGPSPGLLWFGFQLNGFFHCCPVIITSPWLCSPLEVSVFPSSASYSQLFHTNLLNCLLPPLSIHCCICPFFQKVLRSSMPNWWARVVPSPSIISLVVIIWSSEPSSAFSPFTRALSPPQDPPHFIIPCTPLFTVQCALTPLWRISPSGDSSHWTSSHSLPLPWHLPSNCCGASAALRCCLCY